jgi:hypothetical protein
VSEFPVVHDIEFVDGMRLERVRGGWRCPHNEVFPTFTARAAAERCSHVCEAAAYEASDPKHRNYHSLHADLWDQREGK